MIIKYLLPLLAIAGAGLAIYTVAAQNKPAVVAPPVAQPAAAPFSANVPGAGLVEPSTEFIDIGTHVSGIVTKVFVKAGDKVKAGDPLFTIDDRQMRAELASRAASVMVAQSQLDRMLAMPRPEDVPPAEAKVREMQRSLEEAQDQLDRYENVPDKRVITADEFARRRFAVKTWQERVAQAQADLALLKAGAWKPDIEVSRANLEQSKAELERMKTEIDRLTVRSPVDAEILKVNVRPGEYASGGMADQNLITLGATDVLHIRVDVDENDAWRVKAGSGGMAFVRGNSKLSTKIDFVRFEPYVIPKRSLTGASSERVDTRVLQVIFRFKRADLPVFVGQQMDVFIEAPPLGDATFGVTPESAAKQMKSN